MLRWLSVVLAVAAPAGADVFQAALGEPLREVSHSAEVRFGDGVALVRVRRTFASPGGRADEAALRVETTLDEVVDVIAEGPAGPTTESAVEGVWSVRLPETCEEERATYELTLR